MGNGAYGGGMPRRSGPRAGEPPRAWVRPGAEWPELVHDAPPEAKALAALAVALRAQLEGRTIAGVARDAGLDRSTIHDVLAGRSWWNLGDLAKVEAVLGTRLWPGPE
jgi:hypothetical protein